MAKQRAEGLNEKLEAYRRLLGTFPPSLRGVQRPPSSRAKLLGKASEQKPTWPRNPVCRCRVVPCPRTHLHNLTLAASLASHCRAPASWLSSAHRRTLSRQPHAANRRKDIDPGFIVRPEAQPAAELRTPPHSRAPDVVGYLSW